MSILQEIQKWSEELPRWQQDAIAKLYGKHELSAEDGEHLYSLLKIEHGIPSSAEVIAEKLSADHVAAPQAPDRVVQLTSINNLRNVNALADNQRLQIGSTGLTIIYGENGAGKSGYTRALKKACRARDQRETIYPDARKERGKSAPAQAGFDLVVDGVPIAVEWTDGHAPPEQLSAISIFDSHCAKAYVDSSHGDFAYAPYGLDILEGLVKVCGTLRAKASKDALDNKPNVELFATLTVTPTVVGRLLTGLSRTTKPEDVEVLANLSEEEAQRFDAVTKALAEADPKQKALALRQRASRFANLSTRIANAVALVNAASVVALRALVDRSNTAKAAAELAAKAFKETPGLLPGTGSEAWKELFQAARLFAAESHLGKIFPHLGPESSCPLCQNPLNADGAARIEAFDKFIQQEAEKTANSARDAAVAAYKVIRDMDLSLLIDEALALDLAGIAPPLDTTCADMQKALTERRAEILKASRPDGDWTAISELPFDPCPDLNAVVALLQAESKALDASMNEEAKATMVKEHAELDARKRLFDVKQVVLEAISKFELVQKFQTCVNATGTAAISRKSTDLAKALATPHVAGALNDELKNLNVHELKIVMKNESPLGKTKFKLALELPSGQNPSAILSEGEQRAIAIASFMAEVTLNGGSGGIVFDDPVSSLDDKRRWHVASRLAKEATRRQVIVFTHDIYFMCILQQEADRVGVSHGTQCIHQTSAGFGVQTERAPFDTLSTSKRVGALRTMHVNAARAHKAGDVSEARKLTQDAYFQLRLAWERGIEEILFRGVITRFGEGISTQPLKGVVVEDSDYTAIDAGMSKCSKFAHDPASKAQLPTPHPDELSADIEALETWRKLVLGREEGIKKRRA